MTEAHEESQEPVETASLKRPSPNDEDDADGDWQVVARPNKKAKKAPQPGQGRYPALTFSDKARLQSKINLHNIRDLVLYIFADGVAPQWINVSHRPQIRKIVAVMVPGLEEAMFEPNVDFATYNEARDGGEDDDDADSDEAEPQKQKPPSTSPDAYYPRPLSRDKLPAALQPFADMFPLLWPVRSPGDERLGRLHSPLTTFLMAPAPKEKKQEGGVKPVTEPRAGWTNTRTPITTFVASRDELAENGYVVHPCLRPDEPYELPPGWVASRVDKPDDGTVPDGEIEQGSITAGRRVLALDCEMCMTGEREFALTRISIVDWDGDMVMDELVRPDKPITDYVTQFSGITPAMLAPVTTSLRDIQAKLLDLLDACTILVGHSLESDTKAMQLCHPFIVDTSILFPHPRGAPLKSSLKYLAHKYLGREIQRGGGTTGHNSIEDAKTCLDLVKQKCERGPLYGSLDPAHTGENLFRRLARAGTAYKAQGGDSATGGIQVGKTSAAIDWGDPAKGLGAAATHQLACAHDDDVTRSIIRCVAGDSDGRDIRAGGVDFVWARMRELEAVQGWWNKNTVTDHGDLSLADAVANLTRRLVQVHASLPPCTAFIVYSGSGDPREMGRLQHMQTQWKREYNTPGKKWDDLSVKWTDVEDQALRRAVQKARAGMAFMGVK